MKYSKLENQQIENIYNNVASRLNCNTIDNQSTEQYKLILTIDIHNSKDESILNTAIANTTSCEISAEQVKEFTYLKTLYKLDKLLVHFLATSFEVCPLDSASSDLTPKVGTYSCELSYPLTLPVRSYSHSSIVVDKNTENGKMLLIPQEPHLNENF